MANRIPGDLMPAINRLTPCASGIGHSNLKRMHALRRGRGKSWRKKRSSKR